MRNFCFLNWIEGLLFSIVYFFVRLVLEILDYERVGEIEARFDVEFLKADSLQVGADCPDQAQDPVAEPIYPQVLHQIGTVEFSKN